MRAARHRGWLPQKAFLQTLWAERRDTRGPQLRGSRVLAGDTREAAVEMKMLRAARTTERERAEVLSWELPELQAEGRLTRVVR